ncbi:hypothetical protein B0H14DRAFT_2409660 [Mycena olivaceomarginata]|nr:hypothetical protein B0H14DRAFT_2409660 [Mycena olivaceomarginata]
MLEAEVEVPLWQSVVDAWLTLEHATGFKVSGKALPATGRPPAVSWWVQRARAARIPAGLETEDEREDFYDAVVLWWLKVNPPWRKEGVVTVENFEKHGLKQDGEGDLLSLCSGLNGITSVVACLWWWYRIAEIAEGTPGWRKLVQDVLWVLTEKHRVLKHKRRSSCPSEQPSSKRVRVE